MERISCRTFTNESIPATERAHLEEICAEASNSTFRFSFIEKTPAPGDEKIADYGIIKNARHFIAGVASKDADMVEFGAVLETIVLYAEDMGLSTVWLGGTFKRKGFVEKLQAADSEIVPIVIAVGYAAEKPSLTDRIMRSFVGAAHRKDWTELFFDATGKPLTQDEADKYIESLDMVQIAPSAVNIQPWRVYKDNKGYHFYITRKAGYVEKMGFDIQMIDMGIAIGHFVITNRENGLKGKLAVADPGISNGLEYVKSWLF